MPEIKNHDIKEVQSPATENYQKIHPEKGMTIEKAKSMIDHLFEKTSLAGKLDKFYSTAEKRIEFASHSNGVWIGEPGNSRFYPNDDNAKGDLEKYKQSYIEYKDGNPDFSKVSEATVKIDDMTSSHSYNFKQADSTCAEQWNKSKRDGRSDWSAREVKQWRQEHMYSWHERIDRKTMDLVPRAIHAECKHYGGVSECKQYERENGIGGGFDE